MAGLLELLHEEAAAAAIDVRKIKPLALAYIGDTLFDLYVRSRLVLTTEEAPKLMHAEATHLVKASSQAAMAKYILNDLTEEEVDAFKRGRNQKSLTVPKNATLSDYKWATGLEALFGYLYVKGREERLYELMHLSVQRLREEEEKNG